MTALSHSADHRFESGWTHCKRASDMVHTHVVKGNPMAKGKIQGQGLFTHLCQAPPPLAIEPVWFGKTCKCCGAVID